MVAHRLANYETQDFVVGLLQNPEAGGAGEPSL